MPSRIAVALARSSCASSIFSRSRAIMTLSARSSFFFQAEDGIRDYKVTGVQTCALPISHRRDADQHRGGSQPEALLEIAHDRERAAEPQHLLHGLARLGPIEHADDLLRHVAYAAIGRLGRHRLELAVGDDQKAMLVRSGHQAAVGVLGVRNSDVLRSTAGSTCSASP